MQPGGSAATRLTRSWALRTGSPSSAVIRSPGRMPASIGRALHQDIHHRHAAAVAMPSCAACSSDRSCGTKPKPAAHHVAMRQDLLHDAAHQIDGNREADAFGSSVGAVQHRGVDADQIAVRIDERAAGIAEIDGGIGLDEILESRQPELPAAGGADDALGDGLAQAVGIADREHDIAHPQGVGAAQAA